MAEAQDGPAASGTPRGRGGRPTRLSAGEVDERILDAAAALFLARGFEGTSFEGVAEAARAGKASIYARFPDKAALFHAVIRRSVERTLRRTLPVPPGLPLRDRLAAVGARIVEESLRPEVVALMRLIVAEAARFPEIARQADRIGWDGGVRRVAEVMAGGEAPDAGAVGAAIPTAARFIDLVFVPLQLRALLGEDLAALHAEAPRRIADAVAMLVAIGTLKAPDPP